MEAGANGLVSGSHERTFWASFAAIGTIPDISDVGSWQDYLYFYTYKMIHCSTCDYRIKDEISFWDIFKVLDDNISD